MLTAPVQWLTGNPVLGYNVAFLFSYVLAGSGMYLLAVSITGNRLAAVVSGVAFAFLPYRVAQLPHLQTLHMMRKGQVRWVSGSDVWRQNQFINRLFEVAA